MLEQLFNGLMFRCLFASLIRNKRHHILNLTSPSRCQWHPASTTSEWKAELLIWPFCQGSCALKSEQITVFHSCQASFLLLWHPQTASWTSALCKVQSTYLDLVCIIPYTDLMKSTLLRRFRHKVATYTYMVHLSPQIDSYYKHLCEVSWKTWRRWWRLWHRSEISVYCSISFVCLLCSLHTRLHMTYILKGLMDANKFDKIDR